MHLAVCVDPASRGGRRAWAHDAARNAAYSAVLAIGTLWLAARAEGVGLGWVSILDPAAALTTLDVPAGWGLVAYLCLGYPAGRQWCRSWSVRGGRCGAGWSCSGGKAGWR